MGMSREAAIAELARRRALRGVRPQAGVDVRKGAVSLPKQPWGEVDPDAGAKMDAMAKAEAEKFLPGVKAGLTSVPPTLAGAWGSIQAAVAPKEAVDDSGRPLTGIQGLLAKMKATPDMMRQGYDDAVAKAEAKNAKGFDSSPLGYVLGKGVQSAPLLAYSPARAIPGLAGVAGRIGTGTGTGFVLGALDNGADPVAGGLRGAAWGGAGAALGEVSGPIANELRDSAQKNALRAAGATKPARVLMEKLHPGGAAAVGEEALKSRAVPVLAWPGRIARRAEERMIGANEGITQSLLDADRRGATMDLSRAADRTRDLGTSALKEFGGPKVQGAANDAADELTRLGRMSVPAPAPSYAMDPHGYGSPAMETPAGPIKVPLTEGRRIRISVDKQLPWTARELGPVGQNLHDVRGILNDETVRGLQETTPDLEPGYSGAMKKYSDLAALRDVAKPAEQGAIGRTPIGLRDMGIGSAGYLAGGPAAGAAAALGSKLVRTIAPGIAARTLYRTSQALPAIGAAGAVASRAAAATDRERLMKWLADHPETK